MAHNNFRSFFLSFQNYSLETSANLERFMYRSSMYVHTYASLKCINVFMDSGSGRIINHGARRTTLKTTKGMIGMADDAGRRHSHLEQWRRHGHDGASTTASYRNVSTVVIGMVVVVVLIGLMMTGIGGFERRPLLLLFFR